METIITEQPKSELSGSGQPRSQGNMTTLDNQSWEAEESRAAEARAKSDFIKALGGLRAYEQFKSEKFITTKINNPALDAISAWDAKTENIYLFGPAGTGKSHLQAIAARSKIHGTRDGLIEKVSGICRALRSADNARAEQEIMSRYSKIPVLGIDDIGIEKHTEFVIGVIYEIIDYRYMNRPGGLIVTSNLSLSELAQKLGDDRIPSRLAQMCKGRIFSLLGEKDWRLK